jgi:hypothetical protein
VAGHYNAILSFCKRLLIYVKHSPILITEIINHNSLNIVPSYQLLMPSLSSATVYSFNSKHISVYYSCIRLQTVYETSVHIINTGSRHV